MDIKTKPVTIHVPLDLLELVDRAAKSTFRSRSNYILYAAQHVSRMDGYFCAESNKSTEKEGGIYSTPMGHVLRKRQEESRRDGLTYIDSEAAGSDLATQQEEALRDPDNPMVMLRDESPVVINPLSKKNKKELSDALDRDSEGVGTIKQRLKFGPDALNTAAQELGSELAKRAEKAREPELKRGYEETPAMATAKDLENGQERGKEKHTYTNPAG